jgi:hypothetical protein
MQVSYSRWERRDATAREDLGRAAINYCRASRQHNAKVTGARYFWVDAGNTLAMLIEGQPGFADFDPEPASSLTAAQFEMNDVARQVTNEVWTDARLGLEAYERAGRPSGIDSTRCRVCGGTGSLTGTDVGGGGAVSTCAACGGTGRPASTD